MGTSENPASRSDERIASLAQRMRRAAIVTIAALVLAACGGSGDDPALSPPTQPPPTQPPSPPPPPPQPPAASIAIDQTGLLLPGRGQGATLTARLAAADGTRVTGDITWSSSRPDVVTVDAGGQLSALADSGSAQIFARSGALVSPPLVVIVANAAAGALLLTDAQIVGDPVEVAPSAPPSRDNFYRVTLVPEVALPAVGSLLGGTGSKPLSGRVVAVEAASRTVTLEPVHPRALLPDLNVNEVIDLAQAEATINPEVAALYDVRRDGGLFELTPRPGTTSAGRLARPQAATGTRALPPFTSCEPTITGLGADAPLPVALSLPAPFSVTVPTTLEYVDTPSNGVEKLVVSGTPTVKLEVGAAVTAAFEGKVECKVEIGTLTVPIGGILSWVAGGQIPYGIGVEFGGKLTLATASIGGKVEASTVVRLGFERPAGGTTSFVATMADWTTTHSWTHDWPTVGDFRIEPSLAGYAFAKFEFGSRIFSSLRVEGFTAKLGPTLAGSFAPQFTQIADASYKSGYKLSVDGKASIGQDLEDILKLLGVSSVNVLELSTSIDLSTSPTGTLTADRANFTVGDRVGFRATLDNVEYLAGFGGYVIDEVLLVRQSGGTSSVVGRIEAADGQRVFDFTYDAIGPGSASEFYVFVVVDLLPLDLLSLELAQATAPTDPGGGGGGPVTVLPPAGDDIYGYDINASGHVAGSLQGTVSGIRAFIWRGGSPTVLSKFQSDDAAASARGINDRDDVVGVIAGVSGSVAVLWPGGGSPVDLNARVAGTGWTLQDAIDINNKGQIVGIGTKDGVSAIFLLDSDGSVSKVVDRGSSASVSEVAEDGAVVGSYDFQSGIGTRSYLWRKGEDLIVIEGQARGLSGAGAVVGSVRAGLASNRGVRWHPPFGQSDFTEIKPDDPAHLTWPQDISTAGTVVGFFSGTAPDGNAFGKAFHWRAGVFTDLTAIHGGDAIQQRAERISETGRILVYSYRRDSSGTPQQYFQVVPAP